MTEHHIHIEPSRQLDARHLVEAVCSCGRYKSPASTEGAARRFAEHHVAALRRQLGARQVTGAEVAPFLKMRPEAALMVKIGNKLLPVVDVYYDNETGHTVIEIDIRGPSQ